MGSVFNGNIGVSIFGQSHSAAVGAVIEGLPAGESIDLEALQAFMARRAGGKEWSTSRREADVPEILSGLAGGKTCGAPLALIIRNENVNPGDYAEIRDVPRPGHADYTAYIKYGGNEDVSGGGHFSGRLTAPLCAVGGVCLQILERRGIEIGAHLLSVGDIVDGRYDPVNLAPDRLHAAGEFPALNAEAGEKMRALILKAKEEKDSVGGVIECAAVGVPAGLGDPMFDGMENRIARIAFAVPAVKGIEFGAGFDSAKLRGSENNDPYFMKDGKIGIASNNAGGILGGITTGMPLIFRAAVKPTPSIGKKQNSVSFSERKDTILEIRGRHDPCIAPRAVPCMEAVMALAVMDAMMEK